jgi:arginine decarboxylase
VHIALGVNGYRIDHVVEGDSVTEVLGYVQYQKQHLVQRMRQANEEALRRGLLTFEESALLMRRYDEGLSGYTYLEEEDPATRIESGATGLTAAPLALLPGPAPSPEPALVSSAEPPSPALPEAAPRRRKRTAAEGPPEQSSFLPGQEP